MTAPVSLCLIVKNEEAQLEACLRSIRPHVAEINIVDTGSTDSTPDIARKYADKFEVFTACNDVDGLIENFSMARQRSYEMATQPWTMWIDGDDEVVGAEHLSSIIIEQDKIRNNFPTLVFFPYEYAHDDLGNVTCRHYRERLASGPKSAFRWLGPVHEILNPEQPVMKPEYEKVRIVHRRNFTKKKIESGRNLRILKKWYAQKGEEDVRMLYYLGLEYGNAGDIDNAIKFHKRYVELSGWDDERFLACLKIADHYSSTGDYDHAVEWATKALTVREGWAEAYFSLGRSFYFLAQRKGPHERRNWERSIHFFRAGLALPPTKTMLFINPLEREFEIHKFLNLALNHVGDVVGALESANKALSVRPDDAGCQQNRQLYVKHLARKKVEEGFLELIDIGAVTPETQKVVLDAIAGKLPSNSLPAPSVSASPLPDHMLASNPTMTLSPSGFIIPKDIPKVFDPIELPGWTTLGMIKLLWVQLLRHDEVLAARSLLKSAPWSIRNHPDLKEMRRKIDVMLNHIDHPEAYRSIYQNYGAECEAIPIPEEIRPPHGQYARYRYLFNVLNEYRTGTLLDIGSLDGWITNRAGLMGIKAWGVDMSTRMVEIANAKAREFNTGAQHIAALLGEDPLPANFPTQFDVVSLLEVYEHVEDPVALIKRAAAYVKPGGTLVLSTPRGSWCQGASVVFHPKWDVESPREHVRAPILSEVLDDLRSAGLVDVEGIEVLIDQSEQPVPIPTQASICARGRRSENKISDRPTLKLVPKPVIEPVSSPVDIIFYVGHGVEPWNPDTATKNGIGGSETAVIEMARNLARMGHHIRVYGDCRQGLEGNFDGVQYLDSSKYCNITCDVLITSRRPEAVDVSHNVSRKVTFCWIHDIHCGGSLTHERALKIDRVLVLSDWHLQNVLGFYPYLHPSQMIKTRNGIDLKRFDKHITRNPYRAVYSSSPDRGMEVACRIWPRVREKIPGAELHIFYGFQTWEACADEGQKILISSLKKLLHDYESAGVTFHGRVPQGQLAEEYLKSGVWAYPTWFAETSCISAMEAHAAGLRMVTSPIAALNETVGSRGVMIPGDWLSLNYQNQFIDAVVAAMREQNESDRLKLQDYARDHFSWETLAREWDKMIRDVIQDVSLKVVPQYKGFMS
jgi:2-polyprenyl-3-methyl-5-hydroxy-6-metoxy-1,4-benzoquinol methylase/glycosyltransferase involved in cell wall biosynthesis